MITEFKSCKEITYNEWDHLISQSAEGTVFTLSWFLDALCWENWSAVLCRESPGGELLGVLPLYITKKMGFWVSKQPLLSKYWGPIVKNSVGNQSQVISHHKKVQSALYEHAHRILKIFSHHSSDKIRYPIQAQFSKLKIQPLFTQKINFTSNPSFENNYAKQTSKNLRQLSKKGFVIKSETTVEPLLTVLDENARKNQTLMPKWLYPAFTRVVNAALHAEKGFLLSVYSADSELAAAGFFLFDHHTTYFLNGYVMPEFRKSDVMTLLVDEGIKQAALHTFEFDFFGSMMENIDTFFRNFGTETYTYYRLSFNKLMPWI